MSCSISLFLLSFIFFCHPIFLLSGPSAPGSVATRLDVSVEVSSVDRGVDAAAEHGRQQHEVRDQGAHLGHQVITKVDTLKA